MIELRNLSKTFSSPGGSVEALKHISLTVRDGEIYGIIGMSGAGKSTLVRCINMLERPSKGQVLIDGVDIGTLPEKELREVRRKIAMIFQGFNLLMQRNCLDNVCFPLELAGKSGKAARARAMELLEMVGLPDKAKSYPAQLSGGQKQRVAIARALATDPRVLLCDEATSALDPKTTHAILSLIGEINRSLNLTVIVITHQMSVVEEICSRVAILDEGIVAEEGEVSQVFASPRSAAARRLVFPDESVNVLSESFSGRQVRVVFNGAETAGTPLIARMAIEEKIAANILYASTRSIGERVYGSMLLGLSTDDEADRTVAYLSRYDNIAALPVTEEELAQAEEQTS